MPTLLTTITTERTNMPKPPRNETVKDILRREQALNAPESVHPHIHRNQPRKHRMALHMKALYSIGAAIVALPFIITISFLMWMHSVSTKLDEIERNVAWCDMALTYLSEEHALAKEGYQQTIGFDLK